jgi:lipoprotein-anchoring transpeptidase ErfK/SrfK
MIYFFTRIRGLVPRRGLALLATIVLSACGGAPVEDTSGGSGVRPAVVPPEVVARYQMVVDGDIVIPAVSPGYLTLQNPRTEVYYTGPDAPGTIVVDPYARVLYYIMEGGRAMRYGIAVGREGYGFSGNATVGRKAEWPSWTPTKNMIRREPDIYGPVSGGLPGGIENPLGARALYLYRGGRDTFYRIHGTNNTSTIGRATSAGCIRLFNQDILDLYQRADRGSYVHVRSAAESAIAEDPMVENEHGLMVPIAAFPADVQAQILAGNIPWPKYQPVIGISAEESAPAPAPDLFDDDADPVFRQIN